VGASACVTERVVPCALECTVHHRGSRESSGGSRWLAVAHRHVGQERMAVAAWLWREERGMGSSALQLQMSWHSTRVTRRSLLHVLLTAA
jgi:hypothetical protein